MPASTRKRSRLDPQDRKELLLDVGLELFSERPYDDVSTEAIAERAGISKGLVYHYFPTKRDLYVATLRRASGRLLARTEPDASLPKPMRLLAGLAAYIEYVERYAPSYVALMRGGVGSDPEAAAIVDESRATILRRILDALSVGEPPPALRIALRGWIGFTEAACLDWLRHRGLSSEALLQMMLAAMGAALEAAQTADPSVRVDLS